MLRVYEPVCLDVTSQSRQSGQFTVLHGFHHRSLILVIICLLCSQSPAPSRHFNNWRVSSHCHKKSSDIYTENVCHCIHLLPGKRVKTKTNPDQFVRFRLSELFSSSPLRHCKKHTPLVLIHFQIHRFILRRSFEFIIASVVTARSQGFERHEWIKKKKVFLK